MKNVLFAALFGVVAATTTWAQTPAPAQPAPPAAPARASAQAPPAAPAPPPPIAAQVPVSPARAYPNPPRNVRFEIVITETGTAKPSTKTVSLTVNDGGGSGSVRNSTKDNGAWLNVDVRGVQAFEGGTVRAAINVEYQSVPPEAPAPSGPISSSITSMFQDGRRTQILQTADPLSDRRTSIEVTMTVLK